MTAGRLLRSCPAASRSWPRSASWPGSSPCSGPSPTPFTGDFAHQGVRAALRAVGAEMGSLPRRRLLVRLQPDGDRAALCLRRTAPARADRHRLQERQLPAQRRADARRHDPGGADGAPASHRAVALRQRRGHLCDAPLDACRGHHGRRHRGPLHPQGRRALRDPARSAAPAHRDDRRLRHSRRRPDHAAAADRQSSPGRSRAARSRSPCPRRCRTRRPTRCASRRSDRRGAAAS